MTTSKLFYPTGFDTDPYIIHTANEVNDLGEMAQKVNSLLEESWFMKKNFYRFDRLTKREQEIIALLAQGKPAIISRISLASPDLP